LSSGWEEILTDSQVSVTGTEVTKNRFLYLLEEDRESEACIKPEINAFANWAR